MKKTRIVKTLLSLMLAISFALGLVSCALGETADSGVGGGAFNHAGLSGGDRSEMSDGFVKKSDGTEASPPDASSDVRPEEPRELSDQEIGELYQAGLITAGAWNDNENYGMWQELFLQGQTSEESGKFFSLLEQYTPDYWHLDTSERVKVTVTAGDEPVANAKVACRDAEQNLLYAARTDARGVAYFFTNAEAGDVVVMGDDAVLGSAAFTDQERELTISLSENQEKRDLIELMFVVDVTGSMGDELSYLKNELGDVIRRIAVDQSNTRISLSFLFYRDHGDSEVFCYVDFRDVTEPEHYAIQQKELAKQFAMGGGDYPEAMDEALELAVSKQWSDSATKMIFLVLDAPCHQREENRTRFAAAVRDAAAKGIRICPVLASGADTLTEYLTRSAAIMTGGTFVFITDHSGIGGSHLDPNLPNVVIERLNMLLVRLIEGYHTGTFAAPVPWNVAQE